MIIDPAVVMMIPRGPRPVAPHFPRVLLFGIMIECPAKRVKGSCVLCAGSACTQHTGPHQPFFSGVMIALQREPRSAVCRARSARTRDTLSYLALYSPVYDDLGERARGATWLIG